LQDRHPGGQGPPVPQLSRQRRRPDRLRPRQHGAVREGRRHEPRERRQVAALPRRSQRLPRHRPDLEAVHARAAAPQLDADQGVHGAGGADDRESDHARPRRPASEGGDQVRQAIPPEHAGREFLAGHPRGRVAVPGRSGRDRLQDAGLRRPSADALLRLGHRDRPHRDARPLTAWELEREGGTDMSQRTWLAISMAMVILLGSTALAQETIKIGVFGPMTGGAAGYGQSEREAIDLVVEEVNGSSGLLGKKIQLFYGDDAGKPEQAVSIVNRFITADEVVMVLGGISSPTSMAVSQVTG